MSNFKRVAQVCKKKKLAVVFSKLTDELTCKFCYFAKDELQCPRAKDGTLLCEASHHSSLHFIKETNA